MGILTTATVDEATIAEAVNRVAEDGFAVIPGVFDEAEANRVLERLWSAAKESDRRGLATYAEGLDPNANNVRVWNLIDLDPVFAELIAHPVAAAVVTGVLGADYIISNFTANIARPGSSSMMVHPDQSLVMPAPWQASHCLNIIWCLTNVRGDNGATLYLPGSHRFTSTDDVPADAASRMVPFTAPVGSIPAMDGRMWHTSGANITESEDRALLFGFYSQPFVRPQWNHSVGLSPETQATFPENMRYRLGLNTWQNGPPTRGLSISRSVRGSAGGSGRERPRYSALLADTHRRVTPRRRATAIAFDEQPEQSLRAPQHGGLQRVDRALAKPAARRAASTARREGHPARWSSIRPHACISA